jgi:spermidine synthase
VASRRREANTLREQVASGWAELSPDRDRPRAFTLLIDGAAQSYVDLSDPTYLGFEYMRRLGHLVDLTADPGVPLDVLHLGGGALTLPRYVAATRPGSRQRVVEIDGPLIDLVRRELPLPRDCRPRVRIGDARAVLTERPDASADLLVVDVYSGARIPAHLTTTEFLAQAARVLRPTGTYLANLADGANLTFARSQLATLRATFPHTLLAADAAVLKGRRFGNLVLAASHQPLPVAQLTRLVAGDAFPGRVLTGDALAGLTGNATPTTDATAQLSPPPPTTVFGVA